MPAVERVPANAVLAFAGMWQHSALRFDVGLAGSSYGSSYYSIDFPNFDGAAVF